MADESKGAGIPMSDAMGANFQDAMRWFNQLWTPGTDAAMRATGGPLPSMMMPTMDIKELDKRIADLRSVEHWLTLNQGMLRTTIQGLELQRESIAAWQAFGAGAAAAGAAAANAAASASSGMAGMGGPGTATAAASAGPPPQSPPGGPPSFDPAQWWGHLQQQFSQMASSAVAQAAMPPTTPSADTSGEAAPEPAAKAPGARAKPAPRT